MSAPYAEIIDALLSARGINTGERETFLKPDYARDTHDPFLLADIELAVERVLGAIESGERIAIYADFDCDGIPAAVVLHDFLRKIGY